MRCGRPLPSGLELRCGLPLPSGLELRCGRRLPFGPELRCGQPLRRRWTRIARCGQPALPLAPPTLPFPAPRAALRLERTTESERGAAW